VSSRLLVALACLFTASSACSSRGVSPLPDPPTTKVRPSTTSVPDLTGVALREVPGRTTTTVPLAPGQANIKGSVVGPQGPVPDAVVHAERLVGESLAAVDIGTAPDGSFALPQVKGGRWRLRAFRAPDLALVTPEVFYLEGAETKTLTLKLESYDGVRVSSATAPNPPIVDEPTNLVVQVTLASVDRQGVVRASPVPGVRVELFGAGDWRVDGQNTRLTDQAGQALWQVRCRSSGTQPLSVLVGDAERFPLTVAACAAAPPPTTTTTAPGEPPTSSSSSSTTSSSTTTTTRPGQGQGNGPR
jgi:hypothetical protein